MNNAEVLPVRVTEFLGAAEEYRQLFDCKTLSHGNRFAHWCAIHQPTNYWSSVVRVQTRKETWSCRQGPSLTRSLLRYCQIQRWVWTVSQHVSCCSQSAW